MYFEIENTPEHIRKSRRRSEVVRKASPKDECPKLVLAPFRRPPQVIFENVNIGTSCERKLEIFNPTKQVQQITLVQALPEGLEVHLPGERLVVEPETCYVLTMLWSPHQPTSLRQTIHFTNDSRGRYDVSIVLKTATNLKNKTQAKGFKTSPGKMKKKSSKRSPVAIYKKKSEIIYNTTTTTNIRKVYKTSNKENLSETINYFEESQPKCPFDSLASIEPSFSEIFPNITRTKTKKILENTYEKPFASLNRSDVPSPLNVLRPANNQTCNSPGVDVFDHLTFTPLKTLDNKPGKLDQGPKIILSMNSESELDDSLEIRHDKDNEVHSIICVSSSQPYKWMTDNFQIYEKNDPNLQTVKTKENKKIPNTSSPKEFNSPNFSINTDFSRISDLSFCPQRYSTEKKILPNKFGNETDIIDDPYGQLCSDTYTKESPIAPIDFCINQMYGEHGPPHFFTREPKTSRHALFREYQQQKDAYERYETKFCHNEVRSPSRLLKSPPRSVTPPLQSIPEESCQFSTTSTLDKTDKLLSCPINRTFDKIPDRSSLSISKIQSWSKKAVKAEPELWKIPLVPSKKPLKAKSSLDRRESISRMSITFDDTKSINQNVTISQVGNVYSQSFTVDPFSSATYFYDEEAVSKFESEFKRWLNYILTPPADLDSNVEQKIDVGKAWVENRNKEVPLAPTKEQVSSRYHNSHRLDSLRRSAKALLLSPEIAQVLQKLNAQIDKKLIAIRADKNLHLDVGLQKVIMELLLSYNPLWLRIGLETIYNIILPLKSNSDMEGLSTFIIQRLFRNPFLKNKHTKSNAPNMLLPAYMEAIKKFTLKKFFMLIFLLDQAKQRKLISHDPCLFCRNASFKESREIIIRFTRELIAGIGDVTKHLRPLGYVVSHKQSYLDEYKYAVHNIAVDIRDGVRLTKVMEIILIKNGLLKQLRTPAISRLQKIHNVQVAFNALKESGFIIVGDITAVDIADGHREKTLSLLWQIIHVFRAPLFQKAANVIQTWWRKIYEVVLAKRREEERILFERNNAASVIQNWYRRIQYNRLVEHQMQQITNATKIIQKYCRMWLCRTRLRRLKNSVLVIEQWYRSMKLIKETKQTLKNLRLQREMLRTKSAIVIQSYVRRWLCMRQYRSQINNVVIVQSFVRRYIARKKYLRIKNTVTWIEEKYISKMLMMKTKEEFAQKKRAAIVIQSYYRTVKQRNLFNKLKHSVKIVEERYIALIQMRIQSQKYKELKDKTIFIQSMYRGNKCRSEYLKTKVTIIKLQRYVRATLLMRKERDIFTKIKAATVVLQKHVRAHLAMKKSRQLFLAQRKAAILIKRRFRSYRLAKAQRNSFLRLRNAAITLQRHYRSLFAMREERNTFQSLKHACVIIQRRFRANVLMKTYRNRLLQLRAAAIVIQRRFRAVIKMRDERSKYLKLKASCITLQKVYRARLLGKKQRLYYLKQKSAAITIQNWFRNLKKAKEVKLQYEQTKQACTTIQRVFRAYVIGKKQRQEFIKIRTSTICIQKYYRSYIEMKTVRDEYIQLKTATVTIQRYLKCYLETKRQRKEFLNIKSAASTIQNYYRSYKLTQIIHKRFCEFKKAVVLVQTRYRSNCAMKKERDQYLKLKQASITIQNKYRSLLAMRAQRKLYLNMKNAACIIQRKFRARLLMLQERSRYQKILTACLTIQSTYRAYLVERKHRTEYLKLKTATILIQHWIRNIIETKNVRSQYLLLKKTVILVQRRYRAKLVAREIQRNEAAIKIQNWYRSIQKRDVCRRQFLSLRKSVVYIQSKFRAYILRRRYLAMKYAAIAIERHYLAYTLRVFERQKYLLTIRSIIKVQSYVRRYIQRKRYLLIKSAVLTIQAAYRLKKQRDLMKERREAAAVCIQKNVRRYIVQSRYIKYRQHVMCIQTLWRGKMLTRLIRCEFLQKRNIVINIQAICRGNLVRKNVAYKRVEMQRITDENRRHWAASKIQALFRGHCVRAAVAEDVRVRQLRRRWREGALESQQLSMKERHEEAMEVLRYMSDIESVIRAFQSLELLTEVFPMTYENNAHLIVRRVYIYMSTTNRSVSSIEVLKSAAAILVNLARYKNTGQKIYERGCIEPILKFMLRFSNNETHLFCILSTYLWLFSKYDAFKEDLKEFLHTPKNHKLLMTIKTNVDRMKRMASNTRNNQAAKYNPNDLNFSMSKSKNDSIVVPASEPDYGIMRDNKPRYFVEAHHAISCIFETYDL